MKNGIIEPEEEQIPPDENPDELEEDSGSGFFVPKNEALNDTDDFKSYAEPRSIRDLEQIQAKPETNAGNNVQQGTRKVFKKKVPRIYFGTRTHKQVSC